MTNEQINASRYVALRNTDCSFEVSGTQIIVSCDSSSEAVSYTRDTPAATLKRNLQVAAARVSSE